MLGPRPNCEVRVAVNVGGLNASNRQFLIRYFNACRAVVLVAAVALALAMETALSSHHSRFSTKTLSPLMAYPTILPLSRPRQSLLPRSVNRLAMPHRAQYQYS
jgi:hypothetical protein